MSSDQRENKEIVDNYISEISLNIDVDKEIHKEILKNENILHIDPKILIYPYLPLQLLKNNDIENYFLLYDKIDKYYLPFELSVFWSLGESKLFKDHPQLEDKRWGYMGMGDVLIKFFISPIINIRQEIREPCMNRIRNEIYMRIYNLIGRRVERSKISEVLEKMINSINTKYWQSIKMEYPIPPKYLINCELVYKIACDDDVSYDKKGKGGIIYGYPKSFFYRIWALSLQNYPQELPNKIFEEWLKLFEKDFIELSIDDVIKILLNVFHSSKRWKEKFEERIGELIRNRNIDIQLFMANLIEAVNNLNSDEKYSFKKEIIEPFIEPKLIKGTPAWEKYQLPKKDQNTKGEERQLLNRMFSTSFYSQDNYDVFLGEKLRSGDIEKKGKRFYKFINRPAKLPEDEERLILLWLNQFKKFMIRDFAWSLLDNLKYYTQDEMINHYYKLIKDNFKDDLIKNKEVLFIIEPLSGNVPVSWKFIREIGSKYKVSPKEIGEVIYLKELDENDKKKLIEKLKGGFHHIVYMDDLIGTGGTAKKVLPNLENVIKESACDVEIHYWAICASKEKTIKDLEKRFSNVKINISEPLDILENHTLNYVLNVKKEEYGSGERKYLKNERKYLKKMLGDISKDLLTLENPAKLKGKIQNHIFGYENSQLLVAFETNCPNNTLPIFWKDGKYRDKDRSIEYFALFPREGKSEQYKIFGDVDKILNKFRRYIYL